MASYMRRKFMSETVHLLPKGRVGRSANNEEKLAEPKTAEVKEDTPWQTILRFVHALRSFELKG